VGDRRGSSTPDRGDGENARQTIADLALPSEPGALVVLVGGRDLEKSLGSASLEYVKSLPPDPPFG
jgi:hypothetical protein